MSGKFRWTWITLGAVSVGLAAFFEWRKQVPWSNEPVRASVAALSLPGPTPPDAPVAVVGSGADEGVQPEAAGVFADFVCWSEAYQVAEPSLQPAMVEAGVRLAEARRAALADLIRRDPRRALRAAVSEEMRAGLPSEIVDRLEVRVSGCGELALNAVTPELSRSASARTTFRSALIDGREYKAYTYGTLATVPTLPEFCLEGIAIDHDLAVEDQPDARRDSVYAADGQPGSSGVSGRPPQSWTHGPKKVLIIRVDFSDLPGTPLLRNTSTPITDDFVSALFTSGGVIDFYADNSFGKTALVFASAVSGDSSDVTDVLRLPQTASYYATNDYSSLLHSDARAAASAAGHGVTDYDRIGVVFSRLSDLPGSQIDYGGLGNIQGKNFLINGQFTFGTVAHEIGHNYGLHHANLWQVNDGNPVSANGTSLGYGDDYDLMGDGETSTEDFSHWNKSLLGWIPDTAVTVATTAGTYRIHRFERGDANLANPLALKIVRDRTRDYWIGYRRTVSHGSMGNRAYVLWGYNENRESDLLDLNTPGVGTDDAGLAIGQTFVDAAAGITLQTIDAGGSGAEQWIDVAVGFQPRIQWAQTTFVADEQGGSATLTLTRTGSGDGTVSVNYATSLGTATEADFAGGGGMVTWVPGDITEKTVTISLTPDAEVEGVETFFVTLSGVSGGVVVDDPAAIVAIADPGARDDTFIADFVDVTPVYALVLEPEGAMVIGGSFTKPGGRIARLKADGVFDSNFAVDGGAVLEGGTARITEIARQPDGKLIVAGEFSAINGVARNRIARLNADGSLDASFDPGSGPGPAESLPAKTIYAVVIQPDGKIVVGGDFTSFDDSVCEYLVRLNADGSIDGSFVGPDFGATTGWRVEALALQPDGKILVGGNFYFSGTPFKSGVCRLSATGALDPAFSGVAEGAHLSGNTSSLRGVHEIVVQANGKILIAGTFTAFNNVDRGGLARLTASGALDSGFVATQNGTCYTVLVQPDGKIVIGGSFTIFDGVTANRLVRVDENGALDTAFLAAGGLTSTSGSARVLKFALQADGRVVLAGSNFTFQSSTTAHPVWRFFAGLPGLPGIVQLNADSVPGVEGQAAELTVTRTGGSFGAISVNYATVAGTAGVADFTPLSGTLFWANGETASKTITVPIAADGVAEGAENFIVNLGQPLIGGAILGSTQVALVDVDTAFGAWQSAYFSPLEIMDEAFSGDAGDPDDDGASNLLEFALGRDPRTSEAGGGVPQATVQNLGGTNYLTVTFRRRAPALDLNYVVTVADTLTGAWVANAVQVGGAADNGDGTETVTYRDSAAVGAGGATKRFMRVEVTRTP